MIEVFKTNVPDNISAILVKEFLLHQFPGLEIHFDLDDSDKILRIDGEVIPVNDVIRLVKQADFHCEVLED